GVAQELGLHAPSAEIGKAVVLLGKGASFAAAAGRGELGQALSGLSGSLQGLTSDPVLQKLGAGLGQSGTFLQALQSGGPAAAASALAGKGGLLETLFPSGLAQSLAGLGQRAGGILESPQWRSALNLTQAGTQLFQGIASGRVDQALGAAQGLGVGGT